MIVKGGFASGAWASTNSVRWLGEHGGGAGVCAIKILPEATMKSRLQV